MLLSSALLCLANKILQPRDKLLANEKGKSCSCSCVNAFNTDGQMFLQLHNDGDSDDEEADGDSDDADDDDDNADEEADDFDDNSDDYDDNGDDHLYKSSDPIGLQSLSAEPCRARNGVLH